MKLTVTYKSGRVEVYDNISGRAGEGSHPYTIEFQHFPNGWPDRLTEDSRAEHERRVNISLFAIEDAQWDYED